MAQEEQTLRSESLGKLDKGIMLAIVVGFLDPEFMGGLEVTLLRDQGNNIGDQNQTYPVKYASPFYGSTAYEYLGLNKADFNDTQKSYGMWFPTPEIGTTVLVAFIDGEPSEGYFIASVPGKFMNHMIPAIAGTTEVELTEEDKKLYDTDSPLPVGEVNRKTNTLEKGLEIEKIKKPVHPIALRFLEQGLLEDDIRGTTTSTSRRNVPNTVFGISTPGPADNSVNAKRSVIGKQQTKSTSQVPVSRLGGTQFVMDDGDARFLRVTPASEGPVEYVDTQDPKETRKGQNNIPYNEYFRIRTRTGHQILMHNSEDLIYIGNAKGTTWIELTANGKIDIYAQDSISVHTENDINFRADRDINFEAGRNINLRTEKGRLHADVNGNLEFAVAAETLITTTGNLNIKTTAANKITSGQTTDILGAGAVRVTSGEKLSIGAGTMVLQANTIDMNGPPAETAQTAASTSPLSLHQNLLTSSTADWNNKNRYQVKPNLDSIMKRVPMHEPWALHENFTPAFLGPNETDRETAEAAGGTAAGTPSEPGTPPITAESPAQPDQLAEEGTDQPTTPTSTPVPETEPGAVTPEPTTPPGTPVPETEPGAVTPAPTIEEQKAEVQSKINPLVNEYNENAAELNTERQAFVALRKEQDEVQRLKSEANARGDNREALRLQDKSSELTDKIIVETRKLRPLAKKRDELRTTINGLKAERDALK